MHAGKPSNPSGRALKPIGPALALGLAVLLAAAQVQAGGACVVAKRLGDSLAIEWVASPEVSAAGALAQARRRLLDQGYRNKGQDVHAQANTELRHGYLTIVKSQYTTATGRTRTSFGCGFSPRSAAEAERAAVYDLRNYSWGWKPVFGYTVMEARGF